MDANGRRALLFDLDEPRQCKTLMDRQSGDARGATDQRVPLSYVVRGSTEYGVLRTDSTIAMAEKRGQMIEERKLFHLT